jgi:hypothetical protein
MIVRPTSLLPLESEIDQMIAGTVQESKLFRWLRHRLPNTSEFTVQELRIPAGSNARSWSRPIRELGGFANLLIWTTSEHTVRWAEKS